MTLRDELERFGRVSLRQFVSEALWTWGAEFQFASERMLELCSGTWILQKKDSSANCAEKANLRRWLIVNLWETVIEKGNNGIEIRREDDGQRRKVQDGD